MNPASSPRLSGQGPDGSHGAGLDVVTIGHAIVDVLAHAEDAFLAEHTLVKGSMELAEQERAVPLYGAMAERAGARGDVLVQVSGGSAANTAVVVACLAGRSGFVGKVRNDPLGQAFADGLNEIGVRYNTEFSESGAATGRCLINVTTDAERTMCTYLGAARGLRVPDMEAAPLAGAAVTYLEGYLWDEPLARPALERAIEIVHRAGRRFAFTLSDSFLVDRFRGEFHELIPSSVDILFANEHELCALFETADLGTGLAKIASLCPLVAVTRGAAGSLVVSGSEVAEIPASRVDHVVDTTGAGDAYAGGFLFGLTRGFSLRRCAELGGLAASDVISRLGARPSQDLRLKAMGG